MVESFELSYGQWFPIWVLEKSFWQIGGGRAGEVWDENKKTN